MADRTLKRPMFRRGGSTNEGIMSGLVDRKGYAEGDKVGNQQDWRWLDESGLGKTLKFGGNLLLDTTSSIIDPFNVAANKGWEFLTGYNPGFSANRNVEEMKKSIFGDKAEIYDPNDPDRDEDANPNVAEFFGINTDATPSEKYADKEEVPATGIVRPGSDAEGTKPSDVGKIEQVNNTSGEPISAAQDIKTVYEDLLPLLQSTLGVDDSEMNRQKYLELAKFGANLMAQPGGNLVGAIGKAAADPLAGMTRIAETQRQAKRKPAELALATALDVWKDKATNPTAQKIKTLARLGNVSEEEVTKSFLTSTGEKEIEAAQKKYLLEGADKRLGLKGGPALTYTAQLTKLLDLGLPPMAGKFSENAPDREDLGKEEIGNYYVDDEGNLIRWNGKEILFMSDTGFFDKK